MENKTISLHHVFLERCEEIRLLRQELNCILNSVPLSQIEIRARVGSPKEGFFSVEAVSVEHGILLAKRSCGDLGNTPFEISSIEVQG